MLFWQEPEQQVCQWDGWDAGVLWQHGEAADSAYQRPGWCEESHGGAAGDPWEWDPYWHDHTAHRGGLHHAGQVQPLLQWRQCWEGGHPLLPVEPAQTEGEMLNLLFYFV